MYATRQETRKKGLMLAWFLASVLKKEANYQKGIPNESSKEELFSEETKYATKILFGYLPGHGICARKHGFW